MHDLTPWRSLLGGVLLGGAASLLYVGTGRIAGISGIVGALFSRTQGARSWQLTFLAGLLTGGVLLLLTRPAVFGSIDQAWPVAGVAGLLVGFGARLGGGCTSGHGVCGLSRLSMRSLVATLTFIATGVATVTLARVLGVRS